jgi:hypothetical protein
MADSLHQAMVAVQVGAISLRLDRWVEQPIFTPPSPFCLNLVYFAVCGQSPISFPSDVLKPHDCYSTEETKGLLSST